MDIHIHMVTLWIALFPTIVVIWFLVFGIICYILNCDWFNRLADSRRTRDVIEASAILFLILLPSFIAVIVMLVYHKLGLF